MLDESMFEDIHEIAENSAYLRAVEEKDVSLEMYEQLPPYEQCRDIEDKLRADNRLTFECIFNEPTGFYCIKTFLIADYAVDKAIFIKDVEAYKSMRFESARRKVAALLYQRFVSTDPEHEFKHGLSVFQIIQQSKGAEEKKERDGKVQPASINLSASPSHAQSLELKTVVPPASPLNASLAAATSNGHTLAVALPSPSAGATLTLQHVNGLTVGGPSASPHTAIQHSAHHALVAIARRPYFAADGQQQQSDRSVRQVGAHRAREGQPRRGAEGLVRRGGARRHDGPQAGRIPAIQAGRVLQEVHPHEGHRDAEGAGEGLHHVQSAGQRRVRSSARMQKEEQRTDLCNEGQQPTPATPYI